MKKIIKLINNERLNSAIVSKKADECTTGSYDYCTNQAHDVSACTTMSYDYCGKDYTSCREHAYDLCTQVDDDRPCSGEGASDTCSYDYIYNE